MGQSIPGQNATGLTQRDEMKVANRIPSTTWDVTIGEGHHLKVSLAYDKDTGTLREVVFVGRGKSGHGLDDMLSELGIKLSRIIQGRDPESGEDVN